ncbi:hypothetical protein CRG98_013666 [Punica granatum]|uniref:Uncharacterized protein n=1 Tax=Punica granatum TaxID=22663 RepID=A0A2I0KDW5_PUNGR|nr:hypothetical protein CRG98_013666 [Punica granatum]
MRAPSGSFGPCVHDLQSSLYSPFLKRAPVRWSNSANDSSDGRRRLSLRVTVARPSASSPLGSRPSDVSFILPHCRPTREVRTDGCSASSSPLAASTGAFLNLAHGPPLLGCCE